MRRNFGLKPERPPPCTCTHERFVHALRKGRCYACESCVLYEPGRVSTQFANRYGMVPAKKTELGGTIYDSKEEANYAGVLNFRKRAGEIKDWKYHPLLHIAFNDVHVCDYELDFLIWHHDGMEEWVEVKGFGADDKYFRLKWKVAKAYFRPEMTKKLTLVMV